MAKKKADPYDIAGIIRSALADSGRSMYDISKATGVDASQLSRFLAGERDPSLATATKLCRELGLKLGK